MVRQRIMQSKSLYSLDTMRKHRQRHARILRLRKTDHTAGHLLSSTTSLRHWPGGDAADDGFAYSFDDRHVKRQLMRISRSANEASRRKACPQAINGRGAVCLAENQRHSNGVRSAPRLPSLQDDGVIYDGGTPSEPSENDTANDSLNGKGIDRDKGLLATTSSGAASKVSSCHSSSGGKGPGRNNKGEVRGKGRDSLRRSQGSETSSATILAGSMPRESRQNDASSGWEDGASGGSRCKEGVCLGRDSRETGETGGEGGMEARAGDKDCNEEEDLDMIYNPLAFPDEKEGVRILIQASKPLEVLNHAGETWICFIRIMAKDPFDGTLDVRIIHDREEVCKTLLSVEEAHNICKVEEGTGSKFRELKGGASRQPAWASSTISCAVGEEVVGAGHELSRGVAKSFSSEGNLNELLRRLFAEADAENKGYLTPEQLPAIMNHAELGLSGPELQLVIAEADENADGSIDYYEFAPMAFNLVHAFRARRRASEAMQDESLDLDQQAMHDLYDAEFERMVRQLKGQCRQFDPTGTGVITRADFKRCISPDRCVGLTKLESKLLLNLMPKDHAGNISYKKLGAGLEQVRFTTLRNTVAEAGATVTHKYLMDLCREEDAKSDLLSNKTHMKNAGDDSTPGGLQCSGFLRARQLANLLLNAPLLSLSRLHVTAVMSHAHVEDGMVNYVEAVPMMAKTIEEMFHPRSVRMRHDILQMQGYGEGGASTGRGATPSEGTQQHQHQHQQQQEGLMTVSGKSREDIQRIFIDVIREETEGDDFERLKNPKIFAKCVASLDLGLDLDTINALWETADLNSCGGGSFLDTIDFCFNCALFLEREKQLKALQKTIDSPGSVSQQISISSWEAAIASVANESSERVDPLLGLARKLVRHAKVFSRVEGHVEVEFLDDSQIMQSVADSAGGMNSNDNVSQPGNGNETDAESSSSFLASAQWSASGGVVDARDDDGCALWYSFDASCAVAGRYATDGSERDPPAEEDIILRTRRRVPVVNTTGQPATTRVNRIPAKTGVQPSPVQHWRLKGDGMGREKSTTSLEGSPSCPLGNSEGELPLGETIEVLIVVYWDVHARDRAHIAALRVKHGGGTAGPQGQSPPDSGDPRIDWSPMRLTVRVPTIAVVDPQAATKFAERLAQQLVFGICDPGEAGAEQHQTIRLQLAGHDAKAVIRRKPAC